MTLAGATDVLLAGRPTTIFPGQTLLAVGRGAPGAALGLTLEQGGKPTVITTPLSPAIPSELAARAYGQVATAQLEELEDATAAAARAYAMHFRVTGRTCSLLMLETEADYQRFGITPADTHKIVSSTPAGELVARTLGAIQDRLGDPKQAFLGLLDRLARTPGVTFRPAAAYRDAVARLPAERVLRRLRLFGAGQPPLLRGQDVNLKALQMRVNHLYVVPAESYLDAFPGLWSWVRHSLGQSVYTSTDAWAALRESEDTYWYDDASRTWTGKPWVRNLERWLVQRDPAGAVSRRGTEVFTGVVAPENGTDYEGRRTHLANGQAALALFVDDRFLPRGRSFAVDLKVTFLDAGAGSFRVEYPAGQGPVLSDGDLHGAAFKARVDGRLALKRILTPEQQEKMRQMRAERARGPRGARPERFRGRPGSVPGVDDDEEEGEDGQRPFAGPF